MRPAARIDHDLDLAGPKCQRGIGGEGKRCAAKFNRINAEDEMMHDRVADNGHLDDIGEIDPGFCGSLLRQIVESLADNTRQHFLTAGIHHDIGDAAHEVFAETDLRIHLAHRSDDFAAGQVRQMGGDGGGADINRKAVDDILEARPDMDQLTLVADSDSHFPVSRTENLLQAVQGRAVDPQFTDFPLLGQGQIQPLQIAGRVMHVRLAYLDIMQAHDRVYFNGPCLDALAHHLAVHLAGFRHIDNNVAFDQG